PAQRAYAFASSQETCTTGWSSLPSIELSGPSGCFQQAPGTYFHQALGLLSGTGCVGGENTIEPATSLSSGGFGVPGGIDFLSCSHSGFFSAVVTYPVASTNLRNWAFVTSVSSIQNPSTFTRCAGRSFAGPFSEPMANSPAGIQIMPCEEACG